VSHLISLAAHSAWNRRATLAIVVVAIMLSVTLLLGVERLRVDARETFARSVSGTDLVIGPRTSPVQLMLTAVFHIGGATHGMLWQSYQAVAASPLVAWAVLISLGDSHHGFPVLGTTPSYFDRYRYGDQRR